MHANFNLQREIKNKLTYGMIHSPKFVAHHFHSQIEIYLVLSGQMEIIVNDKKKILGAGEISVALSYDAHSYKTIDEAKAAYLIIPTTHLGEFASLLSGKRTQTPFINDNETYKTVLSALESLILGGNEITERGLVYVILGAILDKIQIDEEKPSQPYNFSAEILIYISQHAKEELTLTDVARAFGYNPSYLSRSFRETFGISFIKYLTMIRLRESILLLRSVKMSITECAMESGFGSMRSFYRAFREEFGLSPKEYFKEQNKV